MNAKPIVGITMGDPAGNGPEITVKALAHAEVYDSCRPIVVGDVKIIEQAARFVGRPDTTIHRCEKVSDARFQQGVIDVLHLELIPDVEKFPIGQVSIEGGNAAFQCVKKVIELALAGEVDATCTNALNKEAMNKALEFYHGENSDGYTHFDGHTEIYATYTNTKKYTMMLAHHDLRVVHVSTHVSLREACDRVKKARVLEVIEIAHKACKDMGIENPKVAVAGLNPHCGENGLFGTEEIEEIKPAIEAAKADTERPSFITIKTEIGYGCPAKQGKASAHGEPLGVDNVKAMRETLGWPYEEPFSYRTRYMPTLQSWQRKRQRQRQPGT